MTFDPKHILVATCAVINGDKYLMTQRALSEEKFPGYWIIPGGTIEQEDYTKIGHNEDGISFEPVEALCAREILEETGVQIENVRYLISLAYMKKSGRALCLSMYAEYAGGDVAPGEDTTDARWMNIHELEQTHLVKGMLAELYMLEDIRLKRPVKAWNEYVEKESQRAVKR